MATLDKFRQGKHSIERINKSHLFLLPKNQGTDRVEDCCPRSLSNSIYLIIAKVLVIRLHEVIDKSAGPFQSAFIVGRQVVDSTEAVDIVAA